MLVGDERVKFHIGVEAIEEHGGGDKNDVRYAKCIGEHGDRRTEVIYEM